MYPLFRSLLFRLDPEIAHQLTLQLMRIGGAEPLYSILRMIYSSPSKPVNAFGLTFKNPIGLAAGYDKDAVAMKGLAALGFGHLEVGTVTPKPQPGNPRPRVFRLPEDEAVINRMGFPSKGAGFVAMSLREMARKAPRRSNLLANGETHVPDGNTRIASGTNFPRNDIIIGVNLGKNKDTPLEEAAQDYIKLMKVFAPFAGYLTVNISSPNTIGLRHLQGREMLESLLGEINAEREMGNVKCPILIKISPDLSEEELNDAIGVILDKGMDGIIATNTTLTRHGLRSKDQTESGGLSGSPLRARSEVVLRRIVNLVNEKLPIVSVGGIMRPEDAKHRLELGATLIQIYTGLIYQGPGLVKKALKQ
jgi:dihydroorotate dehydrogenase